MNFNFTITADTQDDAMRGAVEHLDAFVLENPLFDRQKAAVLGVVEAAVYRADDLLLDESITVNVEGELATVGSRGAAFSIEVNVSIQP
jgi:hypothetical protein